jgi:hypothetical protein
MFQFSIAITRKRALIVIFAVISVMIIDSTIVKYIALGAQEFPTRLYISIFTIFAMIFSGLAVVILGFIEKKDLGSTIRRGFSLKNSYGVILLTQFLLIAIILTIILSIVATKSYSTLLILASVYIGHIVALFFLTYLVISLVDWLMEKKNKILWLYTISFSLTALAIIISLIYATSVLTYQPSVIKPYPIKVSLYSLPNSDTAIFFGPALDFISILAFIAVWIVSVFLLTTYTRKMGKVRFWIITSLPLIYFLFPFETYFLNIFQSLLSSSPVTFAPLNVLIFGATKQIGALFFSLVFLTASALLRNYIIHKYLLLTAVGMAILFGSMEIDSVLYVTYPPFGLVTTSFMAIGSYLVYSGIVNSAALVARDKAMRKEFYKSAMSQLELLKAIGVTEMEKEIVKNYKSIEKRSKSQEIDRRYQNDEVRELLHDIVDDLDKDNVREILHDVLTELYAKPISKSKL